MIALRTGRPPESTGTVPDHCAVQQTAATSSGATVPRAISREDTWLIRAHQPSAILLGAAARQQFGLVRLLLGGDHLAGHRDQRHLQRRGAQVDRQDVAGHLTPRR